MKPRWNKSEQWQLLGQQVKQNLILSGQLSPGRRRSERWQRSCRCLGDSSWKPLWWKISLCYRYVGPACGALHKCTHAVALKFNVKSCYRPPASVQTARCHQTGGGLLVRGESGPLPVQLASHGTGHALRRRYIHYTNTWSQKKVHGNHLCLLSLPSVQERRRRPRPLCLHPLWAAWETWGLMGDLSPWRRDPGWSALWAIDALQTDDMEVMGNTNVFNPHGSLQSNIVQTAFNENHNISFEFLSFFCFCFFMAQVEISP